jgi:hypothetical protein
LSDDLEYSPDPTSAFPHAASRSTGAGHRPGVSDAVEDVVVAVMDGASLESVIGSPVAREGPVEESDELTPTGATASATAVATATSNAAATASTTATAAASVPALTSATVLLPGARGGGASCEDLSQLLQGCIYAAAHPLPAAFPPGLPRAAQAVAHPVLHRVDPRPRRRVHVQQRHRLKLGRQREQRRAAHPLRGGVPAHHPQQRVPCRQQPPRPARLRRLSHQLGEPRPLGEPTAAELKHGHKVGGGTPGHGGAGDAPAVPRAQGAGSSPPRLDEHARLVAGLTLAHF